jgi:hypothetical protein
MLGAEAVTLRRFAAGSRGTDGRFAPGATTDTTIYASMQPVSGRDLQRLPEGERSRDALKAYTETALQTAEAGGLLLSDRIVYGGRVYEVFQVQPWVGPLPHYEALVLRLAETGGAP